MPNTQPGIPVYIRMPVSDRYDIALISLSSSILRDLMRRNTDNRFRCYWFDRLNRELLKVENKRYQGFFYGDLGQKATRFNELLASDISAFLKLGRRRTPNEMPETDIYDVALLAVMAGLLEAMEQRNRGDRTRREWYAKLRASVDEFQAAHYPGDLPDAMVNKADWLSRMMSADLKSLKRSILEGS